jgi:ribosome-associated protein
MLRAAAVAPKVRRPTKPSRAAKRRRVEAKRRQSLRKAGRRSPGGED